MGVLWSNNAHPEAKDHVLKCDADRKEDGKSAAKNSRLSRSGKPFIQK
jgi:hypothetical protein